MEEKDEANLVAVTPHLNGLTYKSSVTAQRKCWGGLPCGWLGPRLLSLVSLPPPKDL